MDYPILIAAVVIAITGVTVNGQAPTVMITFSDPPSFNKFFLQATRDQDVVMDCFVENLPAETTVRWQRTVKTANGTLVLSLSQDMGLEDNIHYSIERPTQFTWRLRIRAIQVSDEGQFQCFVLTTLNSRASDYRNITVVVPPSLDLQQTSSDMTVVMGDTVDLMCNATGRPFPTIEWTRLGGALLPIGQEKLMNSLLHIEHIQPADRGVYRCLALNSVGQTQADITVTVRFQPIIETPREVVYQAVGYRVELQCLAEAYPTPNSADATWVFGSTTFTMSSEGYDVRFTEGAFGRVTFELIIFNVKESNFGEYFCRIKNNMGISNMKVQLEKTNEPQASVKLGRVIKGSATLSRGSFLLPFLMYLMLIVIRTEI